MVDRRARDEAAQLLMQFKDGLITSSQFAEVWPGESQDSVLQAICEVAWSVERGAGPELAQGRHLEPRLPRPDALNADGQALFERCALFLRSDLELDPHAPWPQPPQPGRGPLRAAASLVLIGGVAAAFFFWGFSNRTAGLLMLWGLMWTLLFHFAEHVVCRPPEGWSIGTVFWPFGSRSGYEEQLAKSQIPNSKFQTNGQTANGKAGAAGA
jgi:hypothetical protein